MEFTSPRHCIDALWLLLGCYWLVSALGVKRTKRRESWLQRSRYVLPLVVAWCFLARPELREGWLAVRFVPEHLFVAWAGVLLTAAGVAVAVWARWHLGSNWRGVVTLKENHELIRTGPYRTIRHPIYTGILLAFFGTALGIGEVRALVALAITWSSLYLKARREESLLSEEFGPGFGEHLERTGMFLPRRS